jgi:hypothetical protein
MGCDCVNQSSKLIAAEGPAGSPNRRWIVIHADKRVKMGDPEAEAGNSTCYVSLKNSGMNHIRLQTAKLSPQWRSSSQPRQSTSRVQADNLATGRSNFFS